LRHGRATYWSRADGAVARLPGWTQAASAFGRITAPQPAHDPQPVITASFRILLVIMAAGILVVAQRAPWRAAWLLPLAVPELFIRGGRLPDRSIAALGFWWSSVIGVAVVFTGAGYSPLLACLPVGCFLAGLGAGRRGVLEAAAVSCSLLVGMGYSVGRLRLEQPLSQYLGSVVQWAILALVVGFIATRVGRSDPRPSNDSVEQHAEARALLEQLRSVTSRLPGSLDVSTTCDLLLDACLRCANVTVGAVLLHAGDGCHVPLALRGLYRVPWRSPSAESGPLRAAWRTAEPVVDIRSPDTGPGDRGGPGGERGGCALLVVPILSDRDVLGLVTLQAAGAERFTEAVVEQVQATVAKHALQLETAHTFERLRSQVTVAERSRLARDMHDGVAQDLAYIGFELDFVRATAAKLDPELGRSLTQIRNETTRIISDVRTSITDLRSSWSLESGLGSALSSFVRNAGASGPLAVHLTLNESPFRLPYEVEVELLRLTQEFTTLARYGSSARNLWVSLTVEPPAAALRLEHDGTTIEGSRSLDNATHRLDTCGGSLHISARSGIGLVAEATIEGGTHADLHSSRR
jgi:signal transduction histidine kinase